MNINNLYIFPYIIHFTKAVPPNSQRMVDFRNNSVNANDGKAPLYQDPFIYIGPGDYEGVNEQFLSLRVNTNQYARTFQDRSYVFSIKPLENQQNEDKPADKPYIPDKSLIQSRLKAGGLIFNLNVRGKRGNIVQTFPSVEYDFVPNAFSLTTNDMIHFQWTGSDYNPRRGCNDGEGGPPDLNTYSTAANAEQNSRADRSNWVLMNHMGNNVPKDYIGYNRTNPALNYTQRLQIAIATATSNAPCYQPGGTVADKQLCYDQLMRLAYLNQQRDAVSLILRAGKQCLTQKQIKELGNDENTRKNHPLNCAKLNAKPFPYFDGGIMLMKRAGTHTNIQLPC